MNKKNNKLVLSDIRLSPAQRNAIDVATPEEFVKTRKGKGGKSFTYVEGGYVVARLNAAFSPIGWEFEVMEHEVIGVKEIWVKGKLTVIDFRNNYRVSKMQFGTQEIRTGMAIGDALKGASTDCLKKCASYLGVALDIYWDSISDDEKKMIKNPVATQRRKAKDMFNKAKELIDGTTDFQTLTTYSTRIKESKHYTEDQKKELSELIKKQAGND